MRISDWSSDVCSSDLSSVKRLKEMEVQLADGVTEQMSKKEALMFDRELAKLNKAIGRIKDMNTLPEALFVIDVGYHKIAVAEARTLGIPVVAVVDFNHSHDGINYVIPGNDDSATAIALDRTRTRLNSSHKC